MSKSLRYVLQPQTVRELNLLSQTLKHISILSVLLRLQLKSDLDWRRVGTNLISNAGFAMGNDGSVPVAFSREWGSRLYFGEAI